MDTNVSVSQLRLYPSGVLNQDEINFVLMNIGAQTHRCGLDGWQKFMFRRYGMKIPQEVNDALTRKHLELEGRGE